MELHFLSIQHPKFIRRMPHLLFEQSIKVLRIFKTKLIRNLTYRFIGIEHLFLGYINKFVLNIFLCRIAHFLFHQIPKVIGRKIELVRKIT